jgi:hypothetical protein
MDVWRGVAEDGVSSRQLALMCQLRVELGEIRALAHDGGLARAFAVVVVVSEHAARSGARQPPARRCYHTMMYKS